LVDEPRGRVDGVTDATVGGSVTVKAPALVAVPASVLVTVTSRAVLAALAEMEMFTLSVVAFVTPTEFTVMPVPEKVTIAPAWKPVPATVRLRLDPLAPVAGDTFVTVGAALIVKQFVHVPVPLSVFVTVTLRAPTVASDAIVTLTVSCVELSRVLLLTVTPVPEKTTVPAYGPFAPPKFVPVTIRL
jgi:hypothetical protein